MLSISSVILLTLLPRDIPLSQESIQSLLGAVKSFSEDHGVMVQLFDNASIAGDEQLYSALYHAIRAEVSGRSRTRDLSVDVLRYTAGERQIHVALQNVGITECTEKIITLLYFQSGITMKKQDILNRFRDICEQLNIEIHHETTFTPARQQALMQVLERIALVDLKL